MSTVQTKVDPTTVKKKTLALPEKYCEHPFFYRRRPTHEVMVGQVGVGGNNPIRVQSMTIADTMDTAATVKETIALYEAGCEIVRITAPSIKEAENLEHIKAELNRQKIPVPLVADIHYTPNAALVAANFVEKVRINPGNYADKKKFEVREYSDQEYQGMIDRMAQRFIPLVKKCKENGVAMRIGVNHGSLSDRIMCYYGDTPEGMVQSALEFIAICESYDYRDLVVSMKSSNPQVMIQAYRLLAARMYERGMTYPFHLGVTEAGDGEDGRIKSAVGIGSLLEDGLGDTIRVSLTEDSIHEVPVAFSLVDKFNRWQETANGRSIFENHEFDQLAAAFRRQVNPFEYGRRNSLRVNSLEYPLGDNEQIRVGVSFAHNGASAADLRKLIEQKQRGLSVLGTETAANGDHFAEWVEPDQQNWTIERIRDSLAYHHPGMPAALPWEELPAAGAEEPVVILLSLEQMPAPEITAAIAQAQHDRSNLQIVLNTAMIADGTAFKKLEPVIASLEEEQMARVTIGIELQPGAIGEPGLARALIAFLDRHEARVPLVWRYRVAAGQRNRERFDWMLDCSSQIGSLLCDGLGDALIVHGAVDARDAVRFSYNLLQATRLRISKTEFISCPSCGRTLFDLQTTTERIKRKTGHLKGVKIAIMGCIVNGPGEMADADFGYVGTGHKVISLYVGKECVERNIPESEADARLIELIKTHGMWIDPPQNGDS